jgi:hypothetical protein
MKKSSRVKTAPEKSISLKPATKRAIEVITKRKVWFENVGNSSTKFPSVRIHSRVESWPDAAGCKHLDNLQDANAHIVNLVTRAEVDRFAKRLTGSAVYTELNRLYKQVEDSLALPIASEKAFFSKQPSKARTLAVWIRGTWITYIRWVEASNVVKIPLLAKMTKIYLAGHIPCGLANRDLEDPQFVIY